MEIHTYTGLAASSLYHRAENFCSKREDQVKSSEQCIAAAWFPYHRLNGAILYIPGLSSFL